MIQLEELFGAREDPKDTCVLCIDGERVDALLNVLVGVARLEQKILDHGRAWKSLAGVLLLAGPS